MSPKHPTPPAPGAFTLVEVIVSVVISLIIFSTVTTIMVNTLVQGKRARAKGEMARDGALVAQLFSQELRQTGLGVPSGTNINPAYGTVANARFYASLLVGGTSQIGFLGDFARPDANYSAYGALHARELSAGNHIIWHTENNGTCAPDTLAPASGSCRTGITSVFFPGEDGCNGIGAFDDRTCPWGLRRVLPNERLVLVAGDGRWGVAALGNTIENVGPNNIFANRLSTPWSPGTWPSSGVFPITGPGQVPGQGWVATLDRIFYRYDVATRTIQRNHCRGDPDPDNANFPGPTATTIPATLTYTPPGGAATTCDGFEVVARHVESLVFSYFDKDNNPVVLRNTGALKRSVRRISYRIEFRDTIDGRDVTHDVAGSVRLQNL